MQLELNLKPTAHSARRALYCTWRPSGLATGLHEQGGRKGIRPVKNGGLWRWALVSPDGVPRDATDERHIVVAKCMTISDLGTQLLEYSSLEMT